MPEIPAHLSTYLDAFRLLSDCRPWREGVPDPIRFTDLLAYAHELGFFGGYAFDFAELVGVCDGEYIQAKAGDAKRAMENAKKKK